MPLETSAYDAAENLRTPEEIAAYIEVVLEDGDPGLMAAAIGDIVRALGMAQIARDTGRSQESLYRALSEKGILELTTLMGVLKSLGFRLSVRPAEA